MLGKLFHILSACSSDLPPWTVKNLNHTLNSGHRMVSLRKHPPFLFCDHMPPFGSPFVVACVRHTLLGLHHLNRSSRYRDHILHHMAYHLRESILGEMIPEILTKFLADRLESLPLLHRTTSDAEPSLHQPRGRQNSEEGRR